MVPKVECPICWQTHVSASDSLLLCALCVIGEKVYAVYVRLYSAESYVPALDRVKACRLLCMRRYVWGARHWSSIFTSVTTGFTWSEYPIIAQSSHAHSA